MSGCDPLRVHALHDGTLRGDSRAEAERHVAACADCARALAELRALDVLAGEEPVVPAGYFDALPARIADRATGRPRAAWSRPTAWAGALAAALLIALVTPRLLERPLAPPREAAPAAAPQAAGAAAAAASRPDRAEAALQPPPASPLADAAPRAARTPAAPEDETRPAPTPVLPVVPNENARPASSPEPAPAAFAEAAEAEAGLADTALAPLQKSATRGAGLAESAAPGGPEALARARAERDRLVREALRPGADFGSQRLAFEAAAAVMRAGGDATDHALLVARAQVYLARLTDRAERQRVREAVKALAPR